MTTDRYQWLEAVDDEDALAWARDRNRVTQERLGADPVFEALRKDFLGIFDSDARIPFVAAHGEHLYNFWQDTNNPRGVWRRTTPAEYRNAAPEWEVLLDVDALNAAEDETWTWQGASYLEPDEGEPYERCLVSLSRGGSDAGVTREFDLAGKVFVAGGFVRAESKGGMSWIDRDRVYVYTDFGPGTMTSSGYPRIAREWRRGTPIDEAQTVYEGRSDDMYIWAAHDQARGYGRDFVGRVINFYSSHRWLRRTDGSLTKIDVPDSASVSAHREWLYVQLRDPWDVGGRRFPDGALLVTRFDAFMAGERDLEMVFAPDDRSSLAAAVWTKSHLLLNVLEDVHNRIFVLSPTDGSWRREPLDGAPDMGTVVVSAADEDASDDYFMIVTDFLTPTTLLRGAVGKDVEPLKSLPAFFDAEGLSVAQHFTTSDDGTRVPYFVVGPQADGPLPTVLYGYGGFENSLLPTYMPVTGRGWLERGGVFVVANIRGGGEYGPRWHRAALKENRFRAYEDFAAVARDLIDRGVTTADRLGIVGGSNGGLLVGNMLTRYPDLFAAVVCQVPLLDMQRYHKLSAGASWIAEYGDPDVPEEWAYLQTFSPYHNVRADAEYPPVLFTTSTRDDRVHPGHARKMAALMTDQGHDVLYYENVEGGHAGAADNAQRAYVSALEFSFLADVLFEGAPRPPARTRP